MLSQVDSTKPFTLRTDARYYALGAVLFQGDDKEYTIEFASSLLINADKKFSSTELEALAVVWALGNFCIYVKAQTLVVATDHQRLKGLLSLKSPSGRLSRRALQLNPFNLKIEYITAMSNVVALMLRPALKHQTTFCETYNFESIFMLTRSLNDIRYAKKIFACF